MRTTLDIDDDVLAAARERARRERKTVGKVVSELLRLALTARPAPMVVRETPPVLGFRPFAADGQVVTNALIDELRRDDAY
jgi:hypothetical protein